MAPRCLLLHTLAWQGVDWLQEEESEYHLEEYQTQKNLLQYLRG